MQNSRISQAAFAQLIAKTVFSIICNKCKGMGDADRSILRVNVTKCIALFAAMPIPGIETLVNELRTALVTALGTMPAEPAFTAGSTPAAGAAAAASAAGASPQRVHDVSAHYRCGEHNVLCRIFLTRKSGPNLGRSFYKCPVEGCSLFQRADAERPRTSVPVSVPEQHDGSPAKRPREDPSPSA